MSAAALVTGGSGFLGAHLARRLIRGGCKVRILDVRDVEESDLKESVEFIQGDIRDSAIVERAVSGARWVFHNAAALPISRSGSEFHDVNVRGTRIVLAACLRQRVEKVVHVSSSAVHLGRSLSMPVDESTPWCPMGEYGYSKMQAERVCQEFRRLGLSIDVLRPRTLVGPGRLGIFQILFDWIRQGKRIYILGSGDNPYQMLSAGDMAEACWLAAARPQPGSEDFCVGADKFGTVREDISALIRHAGTRSTLCSIPPWLAGGVLGVLDAFRLSPLVDLHYRTPHRAFYFDITKAKTLLGFEPKQSNAEMLSQAFDWYLSNRPAFEGRYGTTHRELVKQGLLRVLHALS